MLSYVYRRSDPESPFSSNMLLLGWHHISGEINRPTRCCRSEATYTAISSQSPSEKKRSGKETRKNQKRRGRQSYRFVDQTRLQVSGGSGGNGSTSMYRIGRRRKRRPDGGHGGNGGSVIIVADPKEQSLRWTRPHVIADSGSHGGSQGKHGRSGKNVIVRVPCGVVVRRLVEHEEHYSGTKTILKTTDAPTVRKVEEDLHGLVGNSRGSNSRKGDYPECLGAPLHKCKAVGYMTPLDHDGDADNHISYDYCDGSNTETRNERDSFTAWGEGEKVEIADLDKPGSHIVVAKGGRGGYGNMIFANTNGPLPSPDIIAKYAEPEAGESCTLEMELKLIADVGLVGFPNAGKSSLLSATSRATPYIAPYPFTTLNPLVGYVEYRDGFRVCMADVPGLIAGASAGNGKGHDFLRHLERTKALLYIIDAAGIDGRDPVEDFEVLVQELSAYRDGDMLNRRCLVVANKVDLLLDDERKEISSKIQDKAEKAGIRMETDVLTISAGVTGEGLRLLTKAIRKTVLSS